MGQSEVTWLLEVAWAEADAIGMCSSTCLLSVTFSRRPCLYGSSQNQTKKGLMGDLKAEGCGVHHALKDLPQSPAMTEKYIGAHESCTRLLSSTQVQLTVSLLLTKLNRGPLPDMWPRNTQRSQPPVDLFMKFPFTHTWGGSCGGGSSSHGKRTSSRSVLEVGLAGLAGRLDGRCGLKGGQDVSQALS